MDGSRGVELALPVAWNRSRATALGVTLLLHAVVFAWLLALRFERPVGPISEAEIAWLPMPAPAPPAQRPLPNLPPLRIEAITLLPLPEPAPVAEPITADDWRGTARDVAGAIGGGPGRRTFGETPEGEPKRLKEETPPSIWKKPLPRVGTTVTTPEGETILWVSDYCYISLQSRSLTMQDIHQARQGVRTCIFYQVGGKKAGSDQFDSIKEPPKKAQQEPGCGPDGVGLSCGR